MSRRICVLGAGSFGTALAIHLAGAGHQVALWTRDAGIAELLRKTRKNERYLPGAELAAEISVKSEMGDLGRCDILVMAVPSHAYRKVLQEFLEIDDGRGDLVVVSAAKGIETDTLDRMSTITTNEAGKRKRNATFAVLSGPTFAEEIARGMPSAAVIASEDLNLASELMGSLATPNLRLYSSSDVVGVEISGAAKNVVAIAAGVVSGLGLGHNTLAALITRGLHEITRLGVTMGGQRETFAGLAGLGDLVLTCTGGLSRNRRTGLALAAGKSLDEIEKELSMVAEGVRNSLSMTRLAESVGVEIPITEQMRNVIYSGKSPVDAVRDLMERDLKEEREL